MDFAQSKVIDLVSLIEQRSAVRLKRVASTGNGEYAGNCPFCGKGVDRLRVWPHGERPRYWCRQCGAKGDPITFLRETEGLSFADACQELGIEPDFANSYKGTSSPLGINPSPCFAWQDAAEDFIYAAMKVLHGSSIPAVVYREYLLARGITIETMLNKKIGYVPLKNERWIETSFTRWGLTEDMLTAEQWKKGCVRVPDGLLFPHFGPDGHPWKLAMYRPLAQQLPNMTRGIIAGSKECLLNEDKITQEKPVMMTESFLDAISIEQVAGDLVTAVSTDGTQGCRSLRLQAAIQYAPYVLQSFDNDGAGDEGASWWQATIQNCVRLAPVWCKDANEMLVGQIDIKTWIQDGINNALRVKSDGHTVERSSTPLVESTMEVAPVCVVCSAIVDRYTDQGTPCCEKHYGSQQTIEKALAKLAQEQAREQVLEAVAEQAIEQPSSDPLTQFARTIDAIADVFAPCAIVRHDPSYTLAQHAAFLTDKKERERIAKELYMRRLIEDRRYKRLHPEQVEE